MTIKSTGEDAYFVASNSARGFYSYYPQCFDDARIERVFAIKGGPGTGKSRFMRDVANAGEACGWRCEYIYCSSDPDSLDGIILSKEECAMALIDATAPHVYEPSHPGVREELINLGEFWDRNKLVEHRAEIEEYSKQKSEGYRAAYRYLAAYGEMIANRDALVAPYLCLDAMEHYAEKLFFDIPRGYRFAERHALIRSVGMRGEIGFDTYFARAKRIYLIEDCHGSAQYLMRFLYHLAERRRISLRISHDPILPDRIDGMLLCDSGIAFVTGRIEECQYPHKRIGTRRFIEISKMKTAKPALYHAERMARAMLGGAIDAMERVRDAHFEIENLYINAMDFDKKEEFTRRFCEGVFQS